jgi:hypothetical protein
MLVEVVGNTVFLVRRENSPTRFIPDVRGFGHTFPEFYTTWESETKNSQSHQRVIQYRFGGMTCLVRFEADGYLPGMGLRQNFSAPVEEQRKIPSVIDTINFIGQELDKKSITAQIPSNGSVLTVIRRGYFVPQHAIFDLKTRSVKKRDHGILEEELPRLWVAQIPNRSANPTLAKEQKNASTRCQHLLVL